VVTHNKKTRLKVSKVPGFANTDITPPFLGLLEGGIPAKTVRATPDDTPVILIDHVLEEEFESCRNVRVITC
jgi:hypothetical protein